MKQFFLGFLFCSITSFLTPLVSSASEGFHVAIISDYIYTDSGSSRVRQQVSLTNETSHLYANTYQLTIEGDSPQNLVGYDSSGPLKLSASPGPDPKVTRINIVFNTPQVGKGSTQRFTLEYDYKPAIKNGQVWEIILPRLSQPEFIDTYILNLKVPESFGNPAFITPSPDSSQPQLFTFTKDQLASSGVIAAFGHLQTYSFRLTYNLSNPSKQKTTRTVILPPDTSYQKIYYENIFPLPDSVTADPDGNWLAEYSLDRGQNLEVVAAGQVRLYANPGIVPIPPPSSTLDEYVSPKKYWESTNPVITELASDLTTPEKIFWHVVKILKFDRDLLSSPNSVTRLGAVAALQNSTALCNEFTDLFITLARANGIPARRLVGYAYTNDFQLRPLTLAGNLLHAWPEYWDNTRQTWISIDPTWTNTSGGVDYFHSFDLNHFVFAINGLDSENPLPVGQYVENSGLVSSYEVQFDQYRDHEPEFPEINLIKPFAFLPFVKNRVYLEIDNSSGGAIYKLPVNIASSGIELDYNPGTNQLQFPPYSKVKIPITLKSSLIPRITSPYIHVKISDRSLTYNIPQKVFFVWYGIFILIISALLIGLAAISVHSGSLYLQGRSQRDPLRGQGQKPQKPR